MNHQPPRDGPDFPGKPGQSTRMSAQPGFAGRIRWQPPRQTSIDAPRPPHFPASATRASHAENASAVCATHSLFRRRRAKAAGRLNGAGAGSDREKTDPLPATAAYRASWPDRYRRAASAAADGAHRRRDRRDTDARTAWPRSAHRGLRRRVKPAPLRAPAAKPQATRSVAANHQGRQYPARHEPGEHGYDKTGAGSALRPWQNDPAPRPPAPRPDQFPP